MAEVLVKETLPGVENELTPGSSDTAERGRKRAVRLRFKHGNCDRFGFAYHLPQPPSPSSFDALWKCVDVEMSAGRRRSVT
eukprot:superscaffoldBa00007332_g22431